MRAIIGMGMATMVILLAACNSGEKNEMKGHDMEAMKNDSSVHATTNDADIKQVAVSFTKVDAAIAASIKTIVDHYLHIKNALATDDPSEAAKGAEVMNEAISKLDRSLLTAEQKKVMDDYQEDLKEHAEHIAKNGSDMEHQREHFATMSEDVYGLVRAFGGGRPLYHDHCPMYNDNKGGMWLSEMKEVKNPFFGSKMPACGKVMEVIQ